MTNKTDEMKQTNKTPEEAEVREQGDLTSPVSML